MKFKIIFCTIGFLLIYLIPFQISQAQTDSETDSLKNLLKVTKGKDRINILTDLTWRLRNSEIENAIIFGTEAVELCTQHKEYECLAKSYSFLGVAYRNIGNYSKAFDLYFEGLEIAKKHSILEQEGYAYINISNLYLYQGYFTEALENLENAKTIAEKIGNNNILGYYYINRGRVELRLQNFDLALENLERASEIRKESENTEDYASSIKYIGDVYRERGAYESALNYYKESVKILENTNDLDLLTNNYNEISGIYLKKKNYKKALVYAHKSYEIADQIGSKLRLRNACQSLMHIHKSQNNFKKALEYQDIVLNLNDTLFSQELNKKIGHIKFLNEKFEYDKKLADINFNHAIEIQKQKQIRNFSLVTGITFILVSVLLFLVFRLKRKANIDLQKKNILIEEQKTKLEKTLEEIRITNLKLKELNDTKDKFFTILSHDLKNPFNILVNFSDLLLNNFEKYTPERQIEILGYINKSAENTYKLLENLLLWSKAQIGSIEFNPTKENIFTMAIDTLELIEDSAKLKSITIHNDIPEDLYVKADKVLFVTIIRNLLTNAVKFTPKGKNVSISAEKHNGETFVTVKDEGIGISEEKMGKLFSVSESISTKGTDDEDGSGIGLILCKEFIEMHGGDIKVESEVNLGTTISFNLPTE